MDFISRIEQYCHVTVQQGIDQPMIEIEPADMMRIAKLLKRDPNLAFAMLLDICAIDYLSYGQVDWETSAASKQGYDRARATAVKADWSKQRFALVYHLLSLKHKFRLRVKVWLDAEDVMPSVHLVWPAALWYEREAFDLFGIQFGQHPDLRRILTDYGFVGYPMRKDFPLVGHSELRYDGQSEQCIYEPVSIEHHTNVPRVIRKDHRYWENKDGN